MDELTARTVRLGRMILARHRAENLCSAEPTDLSGVRLHAPTATFADCKVWAFKSGSSSALDHGLMAEEEGRSIWGFLNGPRFDFDFFSVHVDYGETGPLIRDGQPKTLTVTIYNRYKVQANLSLHWYLPSDAGATSISPSVDGYAMSFPPALREPLKLYHRPDIQQGAHGTR